MSAPDSEQLKNLDETLKNMSALLAKLEKGGTTLKTEATVLAKELEAEKD